VSGDGDGAGARVALIDRDGTIVIDRVYLDNAAGLEFLPGAAEGLRLLHERGYRLVVISNQSGIGRGRITREQMQAMNARLKEMVEAAGARLAGIYFCPHTPEDHCSCRKPEPGLILQAAAELGFDPRDAVVIGDKDSDIEAGRRVGAATVLITAEKVLGSNDLSADAAAADLVGAACAVFTLRDPPDPQSWQLGQ
jgi:D-glycero-D-manno-heptose 1,7-bisphosphate phosphatase